MAGKIIQTAGRDALGTFAPEFAHVNDDILFGENWNSQSCKGCVERSGFRLKSTGDLNCDD